MKALDDMLRGLRPHTGAALRFESPDGGTPFAAVDPPRLLVEAAEGAAGRLVVVHTAADTSRLEFRLGAGARIGIVQLFLAEAFAEVAVMQEARSCCRMTSVMLSSANASLRFDLNGVDAECDFGAVYLAGDREHCLYRLATTHRVADCRSRSFVKGIAGGEAVGEFCGRVYVAEDAQRTDAQQQSRNMLLSDAARILTRPELEIYADDVKCSHGATVGMMDADAILYMRQRGLSEALARRLQIEGFVGDVVHRCGIEPVCDAIMESVAAKLERM